MKPSVALLKRYVHTTSTFDGKRPKLLPAEWQSHRQSPSILCLAELHDPRLPLLPHCETIIAAGLLKEIST